MPDSPSRRCPRCALILPEPTSPHPLPDCILTVTAEANYRLAFRLIAEHLHDLRRAWPKYSAQDRQLAEACIALHLLATTFGDTPRPYDPDDFSNNRT